MYEDFRVIMMRQNIRFHAAGTMQPSSFAAEQLRCYKKITERTGPCVKMDACCATSSIACRRNAAVAGVRLPTQPELRFPHARVSSQSSVATLRRAAFNDRLLDWSSNPPGAVQKCVCRVPPSAGAIPKTKKTSRKLSLTSSCSDAKLPEQNDPRKGSPQSLSSARTNQLDTTNHAQKKGGCCPLCCSR